MLLSSSTTRILLGCMRLLFPRRVGQIYADCRPLAHAALDAHTAAVLFDDPLGVRHPEAEAVALSRAERLEDVTQLLLSHAYARVGAFDDERVRPAGGPDGKQPAPLHRLQGVEDEVGQRGAERRLVYARAKAAFVKAYALLYPPRRELMVEELEHVCDDIVEFCFAKLKAQGAREAHNLVDGVRKVVDGLDDAVGEPQLLLARADRKPIPQVLREEKQARERVPDFVRDLRRDAPQRGNLLVVRE